MVTTPFRAQAARVRRWMGVAAATTLISGCMCHKGVELHGDWSVQLNHVPWQQDGPNCLGGEPVPAELAAPAASPPRPVHRFHPVPTAPAAMPQAGVRSQPRLSTMATNQPTPELLDPASPLPLPENNEAVSVLESNATTSKASTWVFGSEAASPNRPVTTDRRRLSNDWQSSSTRR